MKNGGLFFCYLWKMSDTKYALPIILAHVAIALEIKKAP